MSAPVAEDVRADFAAMQLQKHEKDHEHHPKHVMRTSFGTPMSTRTASQTVGARGPILLQDHVLLDEMQHFDRERIPERVVHAKGAGAHGFFEVTHDISRYSRAAVFAGVGKRTRVFVRFSTVGGERGSADTARDPRGFAIKFYTEDGNWDLVGNNTPVFFLRDPILFPSFIHTQKRNPATNLPDPNMVWDFVSLRPETLHQFMILFSDRGVPDGYRHMNGYGSHTFKLINEKNEGHWCKFHLKTKQGIRNIFAEDAKRIAGEDPDYSTRDLYNAIESGNYPEWEFFIQIMTEKEAETAELNPFDVTKVWPHSEFPLIPVGKLVLNRNPTNYFAEVEQAAFSPAHVVPGIDVSPDKMLQGRLFSYTDTHFHRLGPNYNQIPVNCPMSQPMNIQRDGLMTVNPNGADMPNYFPNSFGGKVTPCDVQRRLEHKYKVENAVVARWESGEEDNYSQPRVLWEKVLSESERDRLVHNIVSSLKATAPRVQERVVKELTKVHPDFGSMVRFALCREHKKYSETTL